MADLSKYLGNAQSADDIGSSNAFGAAAGGVSSGGLSMDQRNNLRNQPRVVGAYQYSKLGRQGSSAKARTADQDRGRVYDPSSDNFSDTAVASNRQPGGIKDAPAEPRSTPQQHTFTEPTGRNYDKYS